jgi:hypothetical protein
MKSARDSRRRFDKIAVAVVLSFVLGLPSILDGLSRHLEGINRADQLLFSSGLNMPSFAAPPQLG